MSRIPNRKPVTARFSGDFEKDICERWDKYYTAIKLQMQGSEEEKNHRLEKRVLRFFHTYKLQTEQYYTERKEVSAEFRNWNHTYTNSIFVYGIDFLSLERITLYFKPFQVKIDLYDDSHCAITFSNDEQLIECLFHRLVDRPESCQKLRDYFKKSPGEMFNWREMAGYSEMLFKRRLWVRFLTKGELYDAESGNIDRRKMEIFMTAKVNFLTSLEQSMKPARPRGEVRRKFRESYGKNWKKQASLSSCSSCDERFGEAKKSFPCEKHYRRVKVIKEEEEDEREEEEDRRFRRNGGRKTMCFNREQIEEIRRKGVRPLPRIEKVTGLSGQESVGQKVEQPTGDLNQTFMLDNTNNSLYEEMMDEFSRYQPFDCNTSVIEERRSGKVGEKGEEWDFE